MQTSVAHRFGLPPGPDAASAFIDLVKEALRRSGAVLVVYPEWRASHGERLVRLARAGLVTDRIAGIPLDLPPLALSLVADQLAFVSPHVRPGLLAGLAPRLADAVYAGAWVNSVANLEHIKTGLGKHVASYLPGGFSVSAAPDEGVHRITASQPVQEISRRPPDPVLLLLTHANGDLDWLRQRLQPALGAVSVTAVAEQPLAPEFWGTKKYAEYVAFSGHPRALHALLSATVSVPCAWCGEPTALPRCAFCAMTQPEAPGVAAPHGSTARAPAAAPPGREPYGGPPGERSPQPPGPVRPPETRPPESRPPVTRPQPPPGGQVPSAPAAPAPPPEPEPARPPEVFAAPVPGPLPAPAPPAPEHTAPAPAETAYDPSPALESAPRTRRTPMPDGWTPGAQPGNAGGDRPNGRQPGPHMLNVRHPAPVPPGRVIGQITLGKDQAAAPSAPADHAPPAGDVRPGGPAAAGGPAETDAPQVNGRAAEQTDLDEDWPSRPGTVAFRSSRK
ncbi:hypothetical protein [Actinomadura sp. K4S16]|uniref:hypothetical protein n=1 Tax=Actinomadura sp. K4S16 TaxID=1316147 RepID=UPI0011EC3562|nr:hypothetical protein [Actinomadura sp. K4S16]